jgi:hypothetical protein
MIALTHFHDEPGGLEDRPLLADNRPFAERAEAALAALAVRAGYLRGTLARSLDDSGDWLLLTEWESVGAYRRALGGYDVKVTATPLLAQALDIPSGFESLLDIGADGLRVAYQSDRNEDDSDRVGKLR